MIYLYLFGTCFHFIYVFMIIVYFCSWLRATIYEYRKHKIVIINELSKPLAFFISIIFHLRNLSN